MFSLNGTHNPHRWYLPVEENLWVGQPDRQFLFGGVGMAASIQAMEQTCERQVIWATAQYLSFARPGKIFDLDVWVPVIGRTISQASVLLHIDDKKIITVNAALGARDEQRQDQWVAMPKVVAPDAAEEVTSWRSDGIGLNSRFEIRVARGHFHSDSAVRNCGDGRLAFWLR